MAEGWVAVGTAACVQPAHRVRSAGDEDFLEGVGGGGRLETKGLNLAGWMSQSFLHQPGWGRVSLHPLLGLSQPHCFLPLT